MNNSTYNFKKPNPAKSVLNGVLGVVILIPALVLLLGKSLGGLLFLMVYISIATHKTGHSIDPKNKRIKKFNEVLGFKFGKWVTLSDYDSYVISKNKLSYSASSRAQSSTYTDTMYSAQLLSGNNSTPPITITVAQKHAKKLVLSLDNMGLQRKG